MSKTSTCPSGDGSLRHPCPSHPPICAEIKPDTSLYTDMPSRLRATALVAEAFSNGAVVETRHSSRSGLNWVSTPSPVFGSVNADDYRIKPEPREWWVNEYADNVHSGMHHNRSRADDAAGPTRIRCFKVREVME